MGGLDRPNAGLSKNRRKKGRPPTLRLLPGQEFQPRLGRWFLAGITRRHWAAR